MAIPNDVVWISYNDYLTYGGDPKVTEPVMAELAIKASLMVQNITAHFYMTKADWDNDPVVFRKTQYAKALAQQVNYLFDLGSLTIANMARQPQSQSIGETSVSYGSGVVDANGRVLGLALEAIDCLEGTGLLYRGVGCGC